MPSPKTQAAILSEALPFMQRYDKKYVVIKYGGHAMGDETLSRQFAKDIILLKQSGVYPIVVHGGGPQIGAMLEKLGVKSNFKDGLRVTDGVTIEVVEMVLSGVINKSIVAAINAQGGKAAGISGKDGGLLTAKKHTNKDLGFVGVPGPVDPHIIDVMVTNGIIPVIAPVAACEKGQTYNINGDSFAGAIASSLKAKRLLLLTDVPGVLDKEGELIEQLTIKQAKGLIKDKTITGGMIPKIESCINVVENGVEGVVIVDGRVPHAVLLELFTAHGAGTLLGKRLT